MAAERPWNATWLRAGVIAGVVGLLALGAIPVVRGDPLRPLALVGPALVFAGLGLLASRRRQWARRILLVWLLVLALTSVEAAGKSHLRGALLLGALALLFTAAFVLLTAAAARDTSVSPAAPAPGESDAART